MGTGSISLPTLLPSPHPKRHRGMGNEVCAWCPTHERQSFMTFSSVGPSHRLQFFKNWSNTSPYHGAQSFRKRLLHRGSPTGSQVLPEKLLLCGLLSMGSQVLPGASPVWALHGLLLPSGHIYLLQCGVLHGLQRDKLHHHGLLQQLQRNLYSDSSSLLNFYKS
ncbi:hypothetical protein QYF61_000851, partial [Mycteria americana]